MNTPNWRLLALVILLAPAASWAQQVTVKRQVFLRSDSSTASQALGLLQPGAKLTLLGTTKQNGFYHVKAEDGREGWVWFRNVSAEGGTAAPLQQPATPPSGGAPQCDPTLWNHVYNPGRLIVKQQCITVTGIIVDATNGQRRDGVRHEPDGDTHGWLNVDPEFKNLLNNGNLSNEGGNLVFEVVCKFPVTQPDAVAACASGFHSGIDIPAVGSHVRVVGTYVQDREHQKWMEIHPVTSIQLQ